MKLVLRLAAAASLVAGLALFSASQAGSPPVPDRDIHLPSGKSQQEEILKADHEKDLKDAAQLIELSEQLKEELEKNDRHVLSISSLKKTEQIEKLAKRIRARLRRY